MTTSIVGLLFKTLVVRTIVSLILNHWSLSSYQFLLLFFCQCLRLLLSCLAFGQSIVLCAAPHIIILLYSLDHLLRDLLGAVCPVFSRLLQRLLHDNANLDSSGLELFLLRGRLKLLFLCHIRGLSAVGFVLIAFDLRLDSLMTFQKICVVLVDFNSSELVYLIFISFASAHRLDRLCRHALHWSGHFGASLALGDVDRQINAYDGFRKLNLVDHFSSIRVTLISIGLLRIQDLSGPGRRLSESGNIVAEVVGGIELPREAELGLLGAYTLLISSTQSLDCLV